MTVQSQTSRADYVGNGATTSFAVPFYFLLDTDLKVLRTDNNVATTLVLGADYTVSGAGNPAGGSVTTTVAPTASQKLSILRNVPYTQLTRYVPNDPFPASSHEKAIDKLTMQVQQLAESASRALTMPPNTTGVSNFLPPPSPNDLIGWNEQANALQNVDPASLATIVAYGTARADLFSGDGTNKTFTLYANPGAQANLDVSVGGVSQRPGVDFAWTSGQTLTFTVAPPAGTNNVLARYIIALPQGTYDSAAATFIQAGTGAVQRTAQDKMREFVSAKDFGAIGDGALHPLSDRFSSLSAAQAVYPFATSLSQSLDYAGIQAAINTGRNVYVPSGVYFINAPLDMSANNTIRGESNAQINRPSTFISVVGNIACFHYGASFNSANIENFYIYYDGGRPTTNVGNDGKIGILMDGGASSPGVISIKNVDVDGAWWAIYDNSGNYLTKYTQVWARRVSHGFYKANGTTIQWDTCYVMDADQAWYVVNCLSPQLINCAADQLVIDGSQRTFDSAGLYFSGCKSLTINGFDGESNVIKNNNAVNSAYMRFHDTIAHLSGVAGHGNSMSTTGTGVVSYFYATGSSIVNVKSSVDCFLDAQTITYTGSGYPNTLLTDATAKILAEGGRFKAPTGGTPVISVVSSGNVVFTDCALTGIVSGGYVETRDAKGLATNCFYTAKGTQAVAATVPTTLFALPSEQGMYLISVWAAGSGTGYASTQLAMHDGAIYLTQLKSGAFISFTTTGLVVTITSQGATTFNWTYTKVG